MSNILAKDRKPLTEETQVVLDAKKLVKAVSDATLTDQGHKQPKIPKRKMSVIGNRLIDNAIKAYEELRYQDRMYPDTKKARDTRVTSLYRSERYLSDLVSDIDILPDLIPSANHSKNWYNNMQSLAIDTEKHTKHLRQTIESKYGKMNYEAKLNREGKSSKIINASNKKKIVKPLIKIRDVTCGRKV